MRGLTLKVEEKSVLKWFLRKFSLLLSLKMRLVKVIVFEFMLEAGNKLPYTTKLKGKK